MKTPTPLVIFVVGSWIAHAALLPIAITRRVPGWQPYACGVLVAVFSDVVSFWPVVFSDAGIFHALIVDHETVVDFVSISTDLLAVTLVSFALSVRIRLIRAQLQEASRESRQKSQFLATISHEIRTPMTAMQSVAELLDRTPLDPRQRRFVRTFLNSGRLLSRLVDDVLDFSRYEGGRLALETGIAFDPGDAAAETAALFDAAASEKGLTLATELDPGLPALVLGDERRFQQVLFNLLSNAVKFTQEGRIDLTLRAEPAGTGRVRLLVSVADTGIGIAPRLRETVFQPFTQAESGIGRRFGGSGLGLAIARSIVTAMGGTIALDSRPGAGTTVRCDIPFPIADRAAKRAAEAEPEPAAPLRLLLVEDTPVSREMIAALLEHRGHRVTAVAGVDDALAALVPPDPRADPQRFDAVVTDVHLPGRSGIDLCRTLRRSGDSALTRLPVVALTADVQVSTQAACIEAGMQAVLTKPVAIAALDRCLADAVAPPGPAPSLAAPERGAPPDTDRQALIDTAWLDGMAARIGIAKLRTIAALLLENAPAYQQAFEAACARGDVQAARTAAHRLSGGASTLGLTALAAEARRIAGGNAPSAGDGAAIRALLAPSLAALGNHCSGLETSTPQGHRPGSPAS